MILSNKIRRDVAIGLAKKAVAKHGQGLADRFDAINKQFWDAHKAKIDTILPVPRSAWANLTQIGMLNCAVTIEPSIYYKPEHTEQNIHSYIGIRFNDDKEFNPIGILQNMSEFHFVRKYLRKSRYSYSFHNVCLVADESVPTIERINCIHRDSELGVSLKSVSDDLFSVVKAFEKVFDDVNSLLFSFKTDKQLLDHLPEAKEFLPLPEPKNSKAVVPAEYVNKLRERIAAGIPDKLGV